MPAHNRQLKVIEFTLDDVNYECQIVNWTFDPAIPDASRVETFCPDGVVLEEGTAEPTLQLTFLSDWREGGISDVLTEHSGEDADFVLDHHPDISAEHVRWTGSVRLKAPPVGGEKNTGERTEITLQCLATPVYTRVGA
jgi:hypothetical protein